MFTDSKRIALLNKHASSLFSDEILSADLFCEVCPSLMSFVIDDVFFLHSGVSGR